MIFEVEGRKVKVVTGSKSQTVNVCTAKGQLGEYEHMARVHPPFTSEAELVAKGFRTVEDLLRYLRESHGAAIDSGRESTGGLGSRGTPATRQPSQIKAVSTPWDAGAIAATEAAIDQLVMEFMQHPYAHRVEHSIHCRLFELMVGNPQLQTDLPFSRWSTQPVHKEWPECVPRPEKGNRRGNFDLVVLSPATVAKASLEQFRQGRIDPLAVIEMGLDYRHDHLSGDVRKLRNSGIPASYLVHLVRADIVDDFDSVERTVESSGLKTAYVRHMGSRVRYKRLGDSQISERSL